MSGGSYIFNTPAGQGLKDFDKVQAKPALLNAFLQDWNDNVAQWTAASVIGDPWSNQNDAPRAWYFNPQKTGWPADGQTVPITWTPFPNRLSTFFGPTSQIEKGGQLPGPLTDTQIYQLADLNTVTSGNKQFVLYSADPKATNVLKVPTTKCPGIKWDGDYMGFSPVGPRGWLDEYCEWSITWANNVPGSEMESITFTCENPAYWLTLWNVSPDIVTQLYQLYCDPAVKVEDLYLTYPDGSANAGQPVIDPTTGRPAYNPTNKWNSGTLKLPGVSGGAMHLTSPPNTLSAEIYLAAASTIQRTSANSSNPQALICCAQYGQNFRNSDPHIGAMGNAAAESALVTLADPVGLYIQRPNASLFKLPPNSPPFEKFWTVKRGVLDPNNASGMDSILQMTFAVPPGAGFSMKDIQVIDPLQGAQPLLSAGQIAKTMQIALRVVAQTPPKGTPPNPRVACVRPQPPGSLQPWPAQLLPSSLFYGTSPTDLPSRLAAGTQVELALIVQGASDDTTTANARIQFDNPGVSATVTEYIPNASAIPGLTNSGGTQAFILQVSIAANAQTGPLSVRALNPGEAPNPSVSEHPYASGLALVVAAT
ncbi:hypothetical protein [Paraburkholderia bannensis]|uniref:hypothetical protein n=1 Tax=Paraburkholderia bannensis TaxID=765414 RepID=UPI002ABD89FE|nr:hypothetical protein [Paraburkholderia bannensis]